MKTYLLLAASGALALDAAAQALSPTPQQPADPAARVPAVTYQSAFQGYTPWREPKTVPWRVLNDEVGRAGGHGGIFGTGGHAGHGVQGKPPSKPPANRLRPEDDPKATADQSPRGTSKAPANGPGGH